MEIYLDNSATTRAYPEVAELVTKLMLEDYGNPSALHQKGVDAEQYLRRARETALEFDASPSYLAENIRFVACKERASGHDSMGSTALAAVEKLVGEFDLEALHTLWEEICHEEAN